MRETGEFPPAIPEYLQEFEREGFIEIENDVIYFRDPVSGERTHPEQIPSSILEDEVFQDGWGTLRRLTQKGVLVKIALNYHGGVADYENLREGAAWLALCKKVGLEWGGAVGLMSDESLFDNFTSSSDGQYARLTKDWLEGEGVGVVPSDVNTHMTGPNDTITPRPVQDELRARLIDIWSHTRTIAQQINEGRGEETSIEERERFFLAWCMYQHARQYLLLAHFGHMLARCESELRPGDEVGLVIGCGHEWGVPQKMRQMNVPLDSMSVVRQHAHSPIREYMFERAVPNGYITREDLYQMATYGRW